MGPLELLLIGILIGIVLMMGFFALLARISHS